MKKLYVLLAFLVVGFSAQSAPEGHDFRRAYGEAFIFVEGGVEFAVYPDGQFDFFFNQRRNGYDVRVVTPHVNFSFNSGYDYGPYVQYDDFGAVIQVENVPIYYDYYGRIVQAGRVHMSYTSFGMLASIGNLYLHYNRHGHYTHYSGYINSHNPYYVYRPWHRHYIRPHAYAAVVYHQPYRAYYHPHRMNYGHYRNYYRKHYQKDFRRRYYRPGDRIASYHRGRRSDSQRDLREPSRRYQPEGLNVRSNRNTDRDRYSRQSQSPRRISRVYSDDNDRQRVQSRSRSGQRERAARQSQRRSPEKVRSRSGRTPEKSARPAVRSSRKEPVRVRSSRSVRANSRGNKPETVSSQKSRSSRGRGQR